MAEKGLKEFFRLMHLRSLMEEDDCFLLTSAASIRYFTGFKAHEGCSVVLVQPEEKSIIVSDGRYKTQIEQETDRSLFSTLMVDGQTYLGRLAEELPLFKDCSWCLRVEEKHLSMGHYLEMQRLWPAAVILPCSLLIYNIRSIKEADEIEDIKKAIQITEEVLMEIVLEVLPAFEVGMTENYIAAEISYRQRKLGASGDGFPLIVLSGERSALPHGDPGMRNIQAGDILQFDVGCVYEGYHSDISRALFIGDEPTAKQVDVYDLVKAIQKKMISKIKPGINLKELCLEHEKLLKKSGFEAKHGLGHGVGLEIHELPGLNTQDFIAKPGQVVTVEPGIYIPDWGGIRIEDMVLVTEDGHEVLTSFPK